MEKIDSNHLYSKDFEIKVQNFKKAKKILVLGPMTSPFKQLDLNHYDFFLFIDGGAETDLAKIALKSQARNTILIIGDNDSCLSSPSESFDVLFSKDKDFSDLDYLLQLPFEKDKELTLVGFLGGRLDHQLGVYGSVLKTLDKYKFKNIHFDLSLSLLNSGVHYLNFTGGFSLMSFTEQDLSISGNVKYPILSQRVVTFDSLTLSNEAFGEFQIENAHPVLLFFI